MDCEPFDLTPSVYADRFPAYGGGFRAARVRTVLPAVGDGFPWPGHIGLPVGDPEAKRAARAAGAQTTENGRMFVERRLAILPELQPFVPFVARKTIVPLTIETIPTSSFAASLRNVLTPEAWKAYRGVVYRESNWTCQICGSSHGAVECHEVWQFKTPKARGATGVQKLVGNLCLCHECHEIFHPALANVRGRLAQVLARTRVVNAWTDAETRQHARVCDDVNAERSARRWSLDLSAFAHRGPFSIADAWSMDGVGNWSLDHQVYGRVVTRLLGAALVHRGAPVDLCA